MEFENSNYNIELILLGLAKQTYWWNHFQLPFQDQALKFSCCRWWLHVLFMVFFNMHAYHLFSFCLSISLFLSFSFRHRKTGEGVRGCIIYIIYSLMVNLNRKSSVLGDTRAELMQNYAVGKCIALIWVL